MLDISQRRVTTIAGTKEVERKQESPEDSSTTPPNEQMMSFLFGDVWAIALNHDNETELFMAEYSSRGKILKADLVKNEIEW
ncbi:hypothetical protein, partial [Mycobacterium tuberculosis]